MSIIDTFTQIREINRAVEIIKDPENEPKQKYLLNKAGAMISKLIMPTENDLEVIESETIYTLNLLASLEFTKKTKRLKRKLDLSIYRKKLNVSRKARLNYDVPLGLKMSKKNVHKKDALVSNTTALR